MSAKPYLPTTQPTRGEEQEALMAIFADAHWYNPYMHLRMANTIIAAGFRRTVPNRVTKTQLWCYFSETVLLFICAMLVADTGQPFVWGVLVALTLGSSLTFIGGLIINHAIKTGFRS